MRTTVTLDSDTEQMLRRRMAERGVSFKQALNDALRAGLSDRPAAPFVMETATLGMPSIDLHPALRIAGDLEDQALIAKLARGA